jgi:hypothetical protein
LRNADRELHPRSGLKVLTRRYPIVPIEKNTRPAGLGMLKGRDNQAAICTTRIASRKRKSMDKKRADSHAPSARMLIPS